MSLYQRIMARGEYPYREPVRLAAPVPPHEPEPLPDEPFAPVYDYVPLEDWLVAVGTLRPPRWPDALVFGPPGSGDLQSRPGRPG